MPHMSGRRSNTLVEEFSIPMGYSLPATYYTSCTDARRVNLVGLDKTVVSSLHGLLYRGTRNESSRYVLSDAVFRATGYLTLVDLASELQNRMSSLPCCTESRTVLMALE
jgi:hypothetical protein